jgi:phage tail protein X
MATTQYRTIEGDRWDLIAFKAYGDATKFNLLLEANKPLAINKTLPAGLKINIPILEDQNAGSVQAELLPPWKRTS